MPQLRNLLYGYGAATAIVPQEFSVFNTATQTPGNGGQCCLWTVPAGVTTAVFEIWSSGGSGDGGCCCMMGAGAGSGGYAIKACTVAAGQQIRICAAASGCAVPSGGLCGCCSFVCSLGGGGQGTWMTNVCGGWCSNMYSRCNMWINCYSCCSSCYCCGGIADNADFFVPGTTGSTHNTQYCHDTAYGIAANAPMAGGGFKMGPSGCCATGCTDLGFGNFPGGGGLSAQIYGGGCCCGSPGGGGMVYVVYY